MLLLWLLYVHLKICQFDLETNEQNLLTAKRSGCALIFIEGTGWQIAVSCTEKVLMGKNSFYGRFVHMGEKYLRRPSRQMAVKQYKCVPFFSCNIILGMQLLATLCIGCLCEICVLNGFLSKRKEKKNKKQLIVGMQREK